MLHTTNMLFRPSKSLGQNFLINKGIVAKIIVAAELSKKDTVLEIGPGMGVLTEELVKYAGHVIAVEYDKRLFDLLKDKFKDAKNLQLINADIFLLYPAPYTLYPNYKIVANIPYNITGKFFHKFLLADNRPKMFVVMAQKEAGERVLGKNKSILSLLAELYGTSKKVCDVSPGSFHPAPKVASMVIKLARGPREPQEEKILRLAKIGFSSRRKKLLSNLSTGLKISKEKLIDIFSGIGLGQNIRAEELNKDDWLKLAENIRY